MTEVVGKRGNTVEGEPEALAKRYGSLLVVSLLLAASRCLAEVVDRFSETITQFNYRVPAE